MLTLILPGGIIRIDVIYYEILESNSFNQYFEMSK